MSFTNEQLAKAKAAKSAEELLSMAKEAGVTMTEDEAAKYFSELHKEGELSDDELDNVSGGCGAEVVSIRWYRFICPFCGADCKVTFTYYDDDTKKIDGCGCSCGAEIMVFNVSLNADFTKNGQCITVDSIAHG